MENGEGIHVVKYIVKTMSVEEAVDIMRQSGIKSSPEKVKLGIQQGVYTWGDCIQMNAPSCTVYSKLFFKWLEERGEEVDKQ